MRRLISLTLLMLVALLPLVGCGTPHINVERYILGELLTGAEKTTATVIMRPANPDAINADVYILCRADGVLGQATIQLSFAGIVDGVKIKWIENTICGEKAIQAAAATQKMKAVWDFLENPNGHDAVTAIVEVERLIGRIK